MFEIHILQDLFKISFYRLDDLDYSKTVFKHLKNI